MVASFLKSVIEKVYQNKEAYSFEQTSIFFYIFPYLVEMGGVEPPSAMSGHGASTVHSHSLSLKQIVRRSDKTQFVRFSRI